MSMDELPLDMLAKIFLRLPIKSLACCKCVSKLWSKIIEDPYLGIMHIQNPMLLLVRYVHFHNFTARVHIVEPKQTETSTLEAEKDPVMELQSGFAVGGSCNGLVYLQGYHNTNYIVTNPLRKIAYKLPTMEVSGAPCGLGFDDSANTLKMVVLLSHMLYNIQHIRTMIHVLGTRSWRQIPNVPPYLICGNAVFARGFLYWLTSPTVGIETRVIFFDVKKEEFGAINSPENRKGMLYDTKLIDLNGEVGLVCKYVNRSMEIWVMKEHEKKAWTMYCMFKQKAPLSCGVIQVLGVWNNEGDIILMDSGKLFVYGLKTGIIRCVEMVGVKGPLPDIRIYRSSLFWVNGNIIGAS